MNNGPVFHLVVNPSSGRGRAREALPGVLDHLRGVPGASVELRESTDFADAALKCRAAAAACRPGLEGRRADMLVVMGGDGMAHLGLNACAATGVPLGIIPAGTGNDFCRGAGLARTVESATAAIVAGRTGHIDLAAVEGPGAGLGLDGKPCPGTRFVGSVLSTGYDAIVNRHTNALPATAGRLGSLAYAGVALRELAGFTPLDYHLTLDGQLREQQAMFVAVANAGYFGGGMHVCPQASVSDGMLDVTIVHPVERGVLLRLLPRIYSGRHVGHPAIEQLRVHTVRVDGPGMFAMADGEELGEVPVTARCMPGALRVVVP